MRTKKTVLLGSCLLWIAACEQTQNAPQAPQLSPQQQCYEDCTKTVDAARAECREKLIESGSLDRMMDCNIEADKQTETCRAACDEKV